MLHFTACVEEIEGQPHVNMAAGQESRNQG